MWPNMPLYCTNNLFLVFISSLFLVRSEIVHASGAFSFALPGDNVRVQS
jgi:hypothetical protein